MNIDEFFSISTTMKEPSLVVVPKDKPFVLETHTFITPEIETITKALEAGGNYALILTHPLPHKLYELIKQYSERKDEISIMIDGSWKQAHIDTQTTRLVLLVDPQTLTQIEEEYPIRQAVGMVFEDKK